LHDHAIGSVSDRMTDGSDLAERMEVRARAQRVIECACADVHAATTAQGGALERAVREFATSLKAAGVPVERTLALLAECVLDSKLSSLERERLTRTRERIMRWEIDGYYGGG
jgi:hypothetical protein